MRADIIPGSVFPDYELSEHTATRRKLSFLQGQHPMVLVLSRGGLCPNDRRQAELLVQFHREMEVSYCRLVTISTDSLSETNEYRTGVGAYWPFLSDAGRTVQIAQQSVKWLFFSGFSISIVSKNGGFRRIC
jgi:peroxiredoxin